LRSKDVIAGLVALLIMAVFGAGYVAWQIEGTLSRHGWIALGLGVGVTVTLAAGLVALAFASHRRGYDDEAGHL
jgi:hypothetical protein